MLENLKELVTEGKNERTRDLDQLPVREILQVMNDEDKKVPYAVEDVLDQVADAVEIIVDSLQNGGRLFYFGAGTSGRLGILDASECPPTFGTDPELIQGVIAGGPSAMIRAVEGAEDSEELGEEDIHKYNVTGKDVVVGIAASGRTPYVIGALRAAQTIGARTISLSCNETALIGGGVDVSINVVVGPEVVTGSTRLKAGSAQKLVLNMLTTATMIRLGKVYGNLMVNVQATNQKLRERVKRIVMEVTGVTYEEAGRLAELANGDAKAAILMKLTGSNREEALQLLEQTNGRIRDAIRLYG
ncbi:N-acetylmuramic acid 6-phosphate etherase [Brevibacillus borstelensis]|uniref:N-acetylmuramic acid 6-phosphate etherase n=1 Tax=Brevibacillus borstelensis TaxID=45462 RepID=UPI002E21B681|nr:N-acetylmuramic acid 6-phosphate etherase [Brevibacillus borstelensis]MED2010001.1 N-acetylmuramic acid 6-phosphate etherase [Brevibacillus borstelensis]